MGRLESFLTLLPAVASLYLVFAPYNNIYERVAHFGANSGLNASSRTEYLFDKLFSSLGFFRTQMSRVETRSICERLAHFEQGKTKLHGHSKPHFFHGIHYGFGILRAGLFLF